MAERVPVMPVETHVGKAEIKTTTLVVEVRVQVASRHEGEDLAAAADEMNERLVEYLTNEQSSFLQDYGVTPQRLAEAREAGDWDDVSWGGYEGPYAVDVQVERKTS